MEAHKTHNLIQVLQPLGDDSTQQYVPENPNPQLRHYDIPKSRRIIIGMGNSFT